MRPLGLRREADERGEKAVMRPLDLLIVVDEARRKRQADCLQLLVLETQGA